MKKQVLYILFVSLLLLLISGYACSDSGQPTSPRQESPPDTTETKGKVPTVETGEISNITTTTAEGDGKVIDNGTSAVTDRGLVWDTLSSPTLEGKHTVATSVKGSGAFSVSLSGLADHTTYHIRAYATSEAGTGYGKERSFTTLSAQLPVVTTQADYAAGVHTTFVRGDVTAAGGYPVIEKGISWSTDRNPTIEDDKSPAGEGIGGFLGRIDNLQPETVYYVRAYATNKKGTGYGQSIRIQTIAKGNFTYTLHKDPDPSGELKEHYSRIEEAMEDAVYYYENFTSIDKELNVYYNPDVPTADGNINGTIRIGSNPSYQATGTALHEIMHTVGVGQHWKWDELISDGIYQGSRANKVLQFMSGDTMAVIHGDNQHFWPYGINGAHEDTGKELLYIIHTLLVQGMKEDGLPSSY